MHKFLRAIGFSKIKSRKEIQVLITEAIKKADRRDYVLLNQEDDCLFVECSRDIADGIGIAVRGEFDNSNTYVYNYYFPYILGNYISSTEEITVERLSEKEAYAGICVMIQDWEYH